MSILTDVARELWKMFVADARLTAALLALVALTATLRHHPAAAFTALALGAPVILIAAVALVARR